MPTYHIDTPNGTLQIESDSEIPKDQLTSSVKSWVEKKGKEPIEAKATPQEEPKVTDGELPYPDVVPPKEKSSLQKYQESDEPAAVQERARLVMDDLEKRFQRRDERMKESPLASTIASITPNSPLTQMFQTDQLRNNPAVTTQEVESALAGGAKGSTAMGGGLATVGALKTPTAAIASLAGPYKGYAMGGLTLLEFLAGSTLTSKAVDKSEQAIAPHVEAINKTLEAQKQNPQAAETGSQIAMLPMVLSSASGFVNTWKSAGSIREAVNAIGQKALGGATAGAAMEALRPVVEAGVNKAGEMAGVKPDEITPVTARSLVENALIGGALAGMGTKDTSAYKEHLKTVPDEVLDTGIVLSKTDPQWNKTLPYDPQMMVDEAYRRFKERESQKAVEDLKQANMPQAAEVAEKQGITTPQVALAESLGKTTGDEVKSIATPPEGTQPHKPQSDAPHIISTAVKEGDKIYSGSKWNQQHDLIGAIDHENVFGVGASPKEESRGFIAQDANGNEKFVSRKEAAVIARDAGQIKPESKDVMELHSEDLQEAPKEAQNLKPVADQPEEKRSAQALGITPGLPDITTPIGKSIAKVKNLFRTLPAKTEWSVERNRADNEAALHARRESNEVNNALGRAMGRGKRGATTQDRKALSYIVEAQGDKNALIEMQDKIKSVPKSWAVAEQKAIKHAIDNFDRLEKVRPLYEEKTKAQHDVETAAGSNVDYRKGYVFHIQEVESGLELPFEGTGSGGGSGFKHERSYDTFADSIKAGVKPKTTDAINSLESRLNRGMRNVNKVQWLEAGKSIVDPTNKQPLIAELENKVRDGKVTDTVSPKGYTSVDLMGKRVAVQNGYKGLFDALTGQSGLRNSTFMRAILSGGGGIKHGLLLFDTFHLGRLAFYNAFLRGSSSFKKGLVLLDNTVPELKRMAANGELPKKYLDYAIKSKETLDLLVKRGYNVGGIQEAIFAGIVHKLPGIGAFNKWLFEKFQRGAMVESGIIEFNRVKKQFPELTDDQVARKVARDLNTRFANMKAEGIFKSKTAQDLASLIFLAPSWNEGLIRSEIGGAKQVLKAGYDLATTGKLKTGTLAKAQIQAILGSFIVAQIINYMTRGKPTWENEEEGASSKISAYVPDYVGKGPGFMLNPLAIPAEITHQIMGVHERTGDIGGAVAQVTGYKFSPYARAAGVFMTGKDTQGKKVDDAWDRLTSSGEALLPLPIPAKAIVATGKALGGGKVIEENPGQIQKQLMSTFGLKTDAAPSHEQRIQALATKFKQEKGIKAAPEFFGGDYSELVKAIRLGDDERAKKAYKDLMASKSPSTISAYFRNRPYHPFTGSKSKENEFVQGLSNEELDTYEKAKQDRMAISQKFFELEGSLKEEAGIGQGKYSIKK